jgi:hypothetical protein
MLGLSAVPRRAFTNATDSSTRVTAGVVRDSLFMYLDWKNIAYG